MERKIFSLILLFHSMMALANPVALKFEDLPSLIKERNQEVVASKMLQQAAESETGHLTRSYLPHLTVSAGGETFTSGPNGSMSQPFGSAQASINIFRGGKDSIEEDARQANVRRSVAGYDQSLQDSLSQARKIYWELIYRTEFLSVIQEALEQNEKNAKGAAKRIKAGMASETDRVEFELNGLKLKQESARLQLEIGNGQRFLAALLGFPEGTLFSLSEKLPHLHETEKAPAVASFASHRDVRDALAQKDTLAAHSSQSHRWWTPSVDIFGGYSLYTFRERDYPQLSDRYEPVVGVRLTMNIFDGLQSRNTAVATSLRADAMASKATQIERNLKAQSEAIKQELEVTHNLIHSSEEIVERAKRYLDRTFGEYERGVKNSPDVLGATNRYYETKGRVMEMKRDYLLAKVRLLSLMGE